MSVLEAMAASLPVVATDVGSVGEMLSDGAGVLVEPGDDEALYRGMSQLIEDKEAASKIALAARKRCVERYSAWAQAVAYAALYRDVMK